MSALKANHCQDCCCAQSWTALGVTEYDARSIPEHITELRAERDALRVKLCSACIRDAMCDERAEAVADCSRWQPCDRAAR